MSPCVICDQTHELVADNADGLCPLCWHALAFVERFATYPGAAARAGLPDRLASFRATQRQRLRVS